MGGRCLCCYGMPHGCDWPAPRRVSSARRSDSGQRNSPGLNAQPGAPARAGASHGACNASECSPRLAQMRPSSPPTVHRLLKKHCDESAMNAAPATHGRLVMTQLWGVVCRQSDSLSVRILAFLYALTYSSASEPFPVLLSRSMRPGYRVLRSGLRSIALLR